MKILSHAVPIILNWEIDKKMGLIVFIYIFNVYFLD